MGYVRQKIQQLNDFSIKQINDNFMTLWMKVFGNIDIADLRNDVGKKLDISENQTIQNVVSDVSGNTTQITQNANSITSLATDVDNNYSLIQQNANEISLKVGNDEVISAINLSTEGVEIQASKVDLSDDLYVGDWLYLNTNSLGIKGIKFNASGTDEAKITSDSYGNLDIFSWGDITLDSDDLNLRAFDLIDIWGGGDVAITTGTTNMFRVDSENITFGDSVYIQTSLSGLYDIVMDATDDVRIYADSDIRLYPTGNAEVNGDPIVVSYDTQVLKIYNTGAGIKIMDASGNEIGTIAYDSTP